MTLDSLLKNHKIFLDYPVDLKKVFFFYFCKSQVKEKIHLYYLSCINQYQFAAFELGMAASCGLRKA